MSLSVSLLLPFRDPGDGRRTRLHRWQLCWLSEQMPDVELVVAGDGEVRGPFNFARAANRAASRASGDILWVLGCDEAPTAHDLAVVRGLVDVGVGWFNVYAQTHLLGEADTDMVLAGADPHGMEPAVRQPFCLGVMAWRADVFADVGGYDERFVGWGVEDAALRWTLLALHGPPPDPPCDRLLGLWHPPAPRGELTAANFARFHDEYEPAAGSPAAMRAVIAAHVAAREHPTMEAPC